jgi:hypothetical protein
MFFIDGKVKLKYHKNYNNFAIYFLIGCLIFK